MEHHVFTPLCYFLCNSTLRLNKLPFFTDTALKDISTSETLISLSKEKSRHKILSVKKIVGKKLRQWENNSTLFTDKYFCRAI